MNILYLHGFGSKFDPNSKKVKLLEKIGLVYGVDIDYELSPNELNSQLITLIYNHDIDMVVGTSMGGWFASHVGTECGIPFVAINPALNPSKTLRNYVGRDWVDYTGRTLHLKSTVVNSYDKFNKFGCGLILLDDGDELFDAKETLKELDDHYEVIMFEGGSHRFDHMKESISHIENHGFMSGLVYGL